MTVTEPRVDGATAVAVPPRARARVRVVNVALAIVVAAGVVARFSAWSPLWLDEAQTVAIARLPIGELFEVLRQDGAPPLYYLLLHGWISVVGDGAFAVRTLSGLIGVATLPLAFAAGRRLGGRTTAWAALVLVATSPFAIRYSTEARMYALVMALVLAGFLAIASAWERPRARGRLVGVAAITGALLLTHYWALYLVLAVLVVLAVAAVRGRHPARPIGLAVAAGFLAFVPWLPTFVFQLRHTGAPWAWRPSLSDLIETTRAYAGGSGGVQWLLWLGLVVLVVLGVVGQRVPGGVHLRWPPLPVPAALGAIVVMALAVALIAGKLGGSPVAARYTAVVFPLVVLLAALGLAALGDRGALRVGAVIACVGLVLGVTEATRPRTQVSHVADALAAHARTGDVVVYCPDQLGPSTSRLVPDDVRQLAYPDLTSPERVDWVDYQDRLDAAQPYRLAERLDARAGDGDVWLVTSPTYVTVGDACRRLEAALASVRPFHTRVVAPSGHYFEQARLERFRG